jgi:hypothetical protein
MPFQRAWSWLGHRVGFQEWRHALAKFAESLPLIEDRPPIHNAIRNNAGFRVVCELGSAGTRKRHMQTAPSYSALHIRNGHGYRGTTGISEYARYARLGDLR